MDQRPKCKSPSIKLLEGNINVNLNTLGLDNDFLYVTSKGWATKEKTDKLHVTKILKQFCIKRHYQEN